MPEFVSILPLDPWETEDDIYNRAMSNDSTPGSPGICNSEK